jgi:HEAT repeat protein
VTLLDYKLGADRDLENPWLKHLKWGQQSIDLPRRFAIGPHTDEDTRRAIPVLIRAIRARDSEVASRAPFLLGEIGEPAAVAVPELISAVKDTSAPRRGWAAGALGSFKAQSAESVPVLIDALGDPVGREHVLRPFALLALGELGALQKVPIPLLVRLLQDSNEYVQQTTAHTLGDLGPEAKGAIPDLLALLKAENYWTVEAAKEALKKLEGNDPDGRD